MDDDGLLLTNAPSLVVTTISHNWQFAVIQYRASHIRFISEFILYATKNTNYADHLIPFIMCFNLVINVGM
jgi:hypothetical protein